MSAMCQIQPWRQFRTPNSLDTYIHTSFFRREENLLLLLQVLHHREGNIQCVGNDIRWGEGEPLRQADISYMIALVEFDPDQFFGFGCVFDVMA